jgi:hypothetical protein
MPPQQPGRLLDVIDNGLNFRTHASVTCVGSQGGFSVRIAAMQPDRQELSGDVGAISFL